MDTMFADSLQRLLAQFGAPVTVREVERTHRADALWTEIEGSGFLDALVGEASGGAGLRFGGQLRGEVWRAPRG